MSFDTTAPPRWHPTGYLFFPYAAEQSGHWWVLRLNPGFPEHDLYTMFVDGRAVADVTVEPDRSLGADLDPAVAAEVVRRVSGFADYGSERGEPCDRCAAGRDGMTRA